MACCSNPPSCIDSTARKDPFNSPHPPKRLLHPFTDPYTSPQSPTKLLDLLYSPLQIPKRSLQPYLQPLSRPLHPIHSPLRSLICFQCPLSCIPIFALHHHLLQCFHSLSTLNFPKSPTCPPICCGYSQTSLLLFSVNTSTLTDTSTVSPLSWCLQLIFPLECCLLNICWSPPNVHIYPISCLLYFIFPSIHYTVSTPYSIQGNLYFVLFA